MKMSKMTVIQLLNKMAKGEEVPRKFTYKGYLWEYDEKIKMWFYYFGESKSHRFDRLFYLNMILNDEVEILEEEKKIPEKLYLSDYEDTTGKFDYDVLLTINEIIDYLDYLKSKGE
jgi:hypothetical protein